MHYHESPIFKRPAMRTTLDIADDVLFAAKDVARKERKPLGQVISELARRAFANGGTDAVASGSQQYAPLQTGPLSGSDRIATYGIQPLPARGELISDVMVKRIRDTEGI